MSCSDWLLKSIWKFCRKTGKITAMLLLALAGAWCVGASYFVWHFPAALSAVFGCGLLVIWLAAWRLCRAAWALTFIEFCILGSFLLLTPEQRFKNEKWNVECRQIPQITRLADGKIKIADVRDFRYRTLEDFEVNYKTMIVDPDKLIGMDVVLSYWGYMDFVSHMLLSFHFSDNQKLLLSFEPRVPQGMKGGCFFPGIYRQYGQMMLFSTPEDVLYLRVKPRNETVYCYRSAASAEVVKKIFMETVDNAEKLMNNHAFYNSLTNNCTTGLRKALQMAPELQEWDWRWLFNGLYDRYLFEKGFLKCRENESFASLKARSLCFASMWF